MTERSNRTLEIFSGPKIFSSVAQALGYEIFTIDRNPHTNPSLVAEINDVRGEQLPSGPLVAWASPPDAAFNLPDTGTNWDEYGSPLTPEAQAAMTALRETLRLLNEINPTWWFIENPYGPLRQFTLMTGFNRGYPTRNRVTIDHRDYGGETSFLTDVWTNAFWWQPRHEAISRLARRPPDARTQAVPLQGRRLPAPAVAEMFEQLDDHIQHAGLNAQPPKLNA